MTCNGTAPDYPSSVMRSAITGILVTVLVVMCGACMLSCQSPDTVDAFHSDSSSRVSDESDAPKGSAGFSLEETPPYSGSPSVEVNENVPYFSDTELNLNALEFYSDLDSLGRCGMAIALVGPETMPKQPRSSIGMIKPSGWQISEYDWIDGKYLFNRCHLIAYSLAAENDNELNLITGTRTMNAQGMLPYEEQVASYVDRTGNHVLYRVTPAFEGDNLVASGVLMEAESIEDEGAGIRFCVWCYNIEPGVIIDYLTGDNRVGNPVDGDFSSDVSEESQTGPDTSSYQSGYIQTYVLNTNSHRFHYPDCPSVLDMKEKNKQVVEETREQIIKDGYEPCGVCKP